MSRERNEQRPPRVSTAIEFAIQSDAQLLQTARDTLARCFDGALLPARDFRWRKLFEVAQHDGGTIWLVEVEHRFDQLALQLDSFDRLVCGGQILCARSALFALAPRDFLSPLARRESAQNNGEPSSQRPSLADLGSSLERLQPDIAREVFSFSRVAHQACSQRIEPSDLASPAMPPDLIEEGRIHTDQYLRAASGS